MKKNIILAIQIVFIGGLSSLFSKADPCMTLWPGTRVTQFAERNVCADFSCPGTSLQRTGPCLEAPFPGASECHMEQVICSGDPFFCFANYIPYNDACYCCKFAPLQFCGPEAACEGFNNCICGDPTPIIISAKSISMTSAEEGVEFDLNADGKKSRTAWTAAGEDQAFLVLDRNGNGLIDNGRELFGNSTDQPPAASPNGFLALAVYDNADQGGNGDGEIDFRDSVFDSLRLWVDANHDGFSGIDELFSLQSRGITAISLDYKESRRTDQYGNEFRFRSEVRVDKAGRQTFAVDVYLVQKGVNREAWARGKVGAVQF